MSKKWSVTNQALTAYPVYSIYLILEKVVTELKGRKLGDFSKKFEFSQQRDQGWCSMTKNEKQNVS